MTIGLFMIGALALIVIGVATFASGRFFSRQQHFVSYFQESANGLDVGAPVKLKGVPIGEVTDIQLRIDLDEETFQVPVRYQMDQTRLRTELGVEVDLGDEDVLDEQIARGLRAQLQMESFVTGKLYVELTYVGDPASPRFVAEDMGVPQIPTVPSPLSELGEEASSLVAGLQAFDVSAINQNLVTILVKANQKLDTLDVGGINASLVAAAQAVEDLTNSREVRQALADLPAVSAQLSETLAQTQQFIQRLEATVGPVTDGLTTTRVELVATLESLRAGVEQARGALSTDVGVGFRMQEALANLAEAAEALNQLARSIERNPTMLIRGRERPQAQPDP